MEKNPVSFLQELMIKRGIAPLYTAISETTGTHKNSFKIRVQCGDKFGEGAGSSKKEAKTNAAQQVLAALNILPSQVSPRVENNFLKDSTSVVCQSDVGINYIGKLQELAAQNNSSLPEYDLKGRTGPVHAPLFTVICKYQNFVEEAEGKTKKEAKNLAAKKMYNIVGLEDKIQIPEKNVDSYLETITEKMLDLKTYEKNQISSQKSAAKAMELYVPLSKTLEFKKHINNNNTIKDYHTILRDSFLPVQREKAMDKLNDTMNACKDCLSLNYKAQNPIALLKAALSILSINIGEIEHHSNPKYAVYTLQLDTNPVIKEIGFDKSKERAEILTVFKMAQTVSIMLY